MLTRACWGSVTGGRKTGLDTRAHHPLFQVCEIIESPLFLKLNPMTKHTDVSNADPVPVL